MLSGDSNEGRSRWQGQKHASLSFREQALKILHHLTDYGATGSGDVKQLKGSTDFRLRIGDYRVRFERLEGQALRILQVKHRKEAYR